MAVTVNRALDINPKNQKTFAPFLVVRAQCIAGDFSRVDSSVVARAGLPREHGLTQETWAHVGHAERAVTPRTTVGSGLGAHPELNMLGPGSTSKSIFYL